MSLREAFLDQAANCTALGSPFMGQLMALMADRLQPDSPLTKQLFDLEGNLGPEAASIPLRLAGALHALRLKGHSALTEVYPPQEPHDDALWSATQDAFASDTDFIADFIKLPPQTNEIRRAACMITAANWLQSLYPLPLSVLELGASAGLNLMFDRFGVNTPNGRYGPNDPLFILDPDWTGTPPKAHPCTIAHRRGVDLNPLNPLDPNDALRLKSYLWPDQDERIERTECAIAEFEVTVDPGDAADWLETRTLLRPGHLTLLYHTVAWQYFPEDTSNRAEAAILDAAQDATKIQPLAWLGMEWDGGTGAAMTLKLWPDNTHYRLGRIDFHGRWIDWDPQPTA